MGHFDLWKIGTLLDKGRARGSQMSSGSANSIQVIHQTRPIMIYKHAELLHDTHSSLVSESSSTIRQTAEQEKIIKIKKALQSFYRFRSRKAAMAFSSWKYKVIYHKVYEEKLKQRLEEMRVAMARQLRDEFLQSVDYKQFAANFFE